MREHGRPVRGHRPGKRVPVRAHDDGAAHPGNAALGPAPVSDGNEHPVHARLRLHPDNVDWPLTSGHCHGRPVHRRRDEISATQRREP